LEPEDLKGFDAVVHLGAFSMINRQSERSRTEEITFAHHPACPIRQAAGRRPIPLFFSCFMYGMSEAAW